MYSIEAHPPEETNGEHTPAPLLLDGQRFENLSQAPTIQATGFHGGI
jgi:hypothetical protein